MLQVHEAKIEAKHKSLQHS